MNVIHQLLCNPLIFAQSKKSFSVLKKVKNSILLRKKWRKQQMRKIVSVLIILLASVVSLNYNLVWYILAQMNDPLHYRQKDFFVWIIRIASTFFDDSKFKSFLMASRLKFFYQLPGWFYLVFRISILYFVVWFRKA